MTDGSSSWTKASVKLAPLSSGGPSASTAPSFSFSETLKGQGLDLAPQPVTRAERGEPAPLPVSDAKVWLFYGAQEHDDSWVGGLKAGRIEFWWHGRAGGRAPPYSKQMRLGDTVLMLVKDRLVASGVLAAPADTVFGDDGGVRWWPVLCVERFRPPVMRRDVEAVAGPLVRNQGTVHPVSQPALARLNELRASAPRRRELPFSGEFSGQQLARGESIGAALQRSDWLRQVGGDASAPALESEAAAGGVDARTHFVEDAPSETEDRLERGPLALFLARRLHLIWCELNGCTPTSLGRADRRAWDRDNFIIHVDAPWGGGKTTFANFVSRALGPGGEPLTESHFLWSSLSAEALYKIAESGDRSSIFAPDFGERFSKEAPEAFRLSRRPWIVARHNAWREQSAQPPWWQIFWAVYGEIRASFAEQIRRGLGRSWTEGLWYGGPELASGAWGLGTVWWSVFRYKIWNAKLKAQLGVVTLWLGLLILLFMLPGVRTALRLTDADVVKTVQAYLGLATVSGLGIAALFSIFGQSMAPDLEFSAEHRHLGVADPVGRFRRMFDHILRQAGRPVLLVVDDIDRCDPKTVVEVLRGLQTIVRSPRMFVMVLGDRAWIETSHQKQHDDLAALTVGSEAKLGARFVEKVFQLSFRLPAIKPETRDLYTRGAVARGGSDPDHQTSTTSESAETQAEDGAETGAVTEEVTTTAADPKAVALAQFQADLDCIVRDNDPISVRERRIEAAKVLAVAAKCDRAELDQIASRIMVAAAGADAGYQQEMTNILVSLADSLPNNPRQIKRIVNTFSVYETVGRLNFNYQFSSQGVGGAERARRWRQLAMWVTLATEWPETWRAIGRQPDLLTLAFGKDARLNPEAALLAGLETDQAEAVKVALGRMRNGRTLRALLTGEPAGKGARTPDPVAAGFAEISMEPEAVREFNRIIWEPGFDTRTPEEVAAAAARDKPVPKSGRRKPKAG